MSESLKDQLRALGLSSRKPAPARNKTRSTGQQPEHRKKGKNEPSLDQAYRMRHRQEKQQKEQARSQKLAADRKRRETNQKILALIKAHAVRDDKADIKRNFLYKGRIRSVLASIAQLQDINAGKLGVVYLSGNYHLMPSDQIALVLEFAPDHVPDLQGSVPEGEEEHPVPDDLTW